MAQIWSEIYDSKKHSEKVAHMRSTGIAIIVAVVLLGCSRRDPIDGLMAKVPYEEVPSYLISPIELPESATPRQLISALPKTGMMGTDHFDFATCNILVARTTHSLPAPGDENMAQSYLAVLLDTNLGQRIVLFQPMKVKGKWAGWYYKIYEVK